MTRIRRLIAEAKDSCKFRGHDMGRFVHAEYGQGYCAAASTCRKCGMEVQCQTVPPPNGIDIGGEAAALNCTV
jgi:hypothetical protein